MDGRGEGAGLERGDREGNGETEVREEGEEEGRGKRGWWALRMWIGWVTPTLRSTEGIEKEGGTGQEKTQIKKKTNGSS